MKKIGLCISGGGTKGLAAMAIVEELLKSGIEFSYISGASVGAVIGGYLAKHGEVTTLKDKLIGMSTREWVKLLDPSVRNSGALIKGHKFHSLYKDFFGESTFADLQTKLVIPATDLHAGKVRYFTKGHVVDAVSATSAYPGVFPPYVIDNKSYCDGGVFDNLPYEVLLDKGMDKVICISLLPDVDKEDDDYSSIVSVITRTFELMMGNALKQNVSTPKNVYIFAPKFSRGVGSVFGINDLDKKYNLGKKEYRTRKAAFKKWLVA